MNDMTLLKAVGDISDVYVEEALPASLKVKERKPLWLNMRLLASAAVVLIAAVFAVQYFHKEPVTLVNPEIECGGFTEASGITGFELIVPEAYMNSDDTVIHVIAEKITEAVFYEGDREILCIRKAKGNDDISGDYTVYENETVLSFDQLDVTCRGDGDLWNLLMWTKDGYTYSVSTPEGITSEEAAELVTSIK